jgi:threonine dehydrogenase-like Zn-dependent dehydrogenase
MGANRVFPFDQSPGSDFDCVIEAVGSQDALDLASPLPRTRGRLVVAGYHQDGLRTVDMQSWNWRGIDVINAHERDPKVYMSGMQMALDLVRRGVLDPSPLFTHRVMLDELPRAFELLQERPDGFMKALVKM